MSKPKAFYITTTLPYVNADPHMGHALEFVQADVVARYRRMLGDDVFFNTGTDEHGQKIAKKADEQDQDRQEYVDHFASQFNRLKESLDLSYDNFIRTTDPAHERAAQHIWKLCDENGDIYKKKYRGLYCVGCEAFKTESDLVDGTCPDHQVEPEEIEEENYFFRLSKYQDYLREMLLTEGAVVPEYRRQEALNFVVQGLEDLSISREKKRMDWGVAVPGDDEHVMYVWFDALTNYISTLGWPDDTEGNYKKYWVEGQTLQLAGKDQIRFQSIIWQAMLKSAGLPATDQIFYHGFINSGGQKMSKSIGNVISPYELVERYGTDAARYILLRHVHPTDDSDLTWEKMDEMYTANLVNGLGNLVARILKMAESYGVKISLSDLNTYMNKTAAVDKDTMNTIMQTYHFQAAMDEIWNKDIQFCDNEIQMREPFKKIKTNEREAKSDVAKLMKVLWNIGHKLTPFMPETSARILEAIEKSKKPDNLFPRLEVNK